MQCMSFSHSCALMWNYLINVVLTVCLLFREIQLRTPNWLFGQRKHAETVPTVKVIPVENANEGNGEDTNVSLCGELNWLSSADTCEDNFRRLSQ